MAGPDGARGNASAQRSTSNEEKHRGGVQSNVSEATEVGTGRAQMFLTTTDMLNRMNSALETNESDASGDGADSEGPKFELQRRLPDGSTRRADEEERKAADMQSKLKQVSAVYATSPAGRQRGGEFRKQDLRNCHLNPPHQLKSPRYPLYYHPANLFDNYHVDLFQKSFVAEF